MKRKSILRNLLLFTGLAISTVILSAQITNKASGWPGDADTLQKDFTGDTDSLDDNEALAEFDKIAQRYEGQYLFITGDILLYLDATDSQGRPTEKTSFTSIHTAGASSYEIDSVQTLVSGKATVIIDKREKSIAVVENQSGTTGKANNFPDITSGIGEFKDHIRSIQMEVMGNDKKLTIAFKEDLAVLTGNYEIIYDPENYRIKKIRMEISDGEVIDSREDEYTEDDELIYTDESNAEIPTGYYAKFETRLYEFIYHTEKEAHDGMLDLSKMIKKNGNTWTAIGTLSEFEILN